MTDDPYEQAMALLHDVATPHGFLASPTDVANYRRVWARDGVVCGLAGLAAGDATLASALQATLETLAAHQGPQGQIPSNVALEPDGTTTGVSYGGVCGRADTIPWFVIGVSQYARHTGDARFAEAMTPAMRRGLDLLTAWEFNGRGLVYVPQGGDWADEYVLHGYVLYDQLLRLWALRGFANVTGEADAHAAADALAERLRATFWPEPEGDPEAAYHPHAYRRYVEAHGAAPYGLAALTPGGYVARFDAWSNALALLLGVPTEAQAARLVAAGEALRAERPHTLVPAFWPPITEEDPAWAALRANYRDRFSNHPHAYHNGGLWPMINGWWGCALAAHGRPETAADLLARLHAANRGGTNDDVWTFPEYLHGETGVPGGTPRLAWSAAGAVLLARHLHGQPLTYDD